jgi:hypothetical protein
MPAFQSSNSIIGQVYRFAKQTYQAKSCVLLLVFLISACNPATDPTPSPDAICWECSVEGMADLIRDLQPPEHLLQPDAGKTGDEFEVSAYFDVLDRLSMQPGYLLDYVYWYDDLGAHPVLYARLADEPPFENYSTYITTRGEPPHAYIDHIQVDGSPEGFFQLIVLRLMGEQFYLYWHATMNDATLITGQTSLDAHRKVVEANCSEPFDPVLAGASQLTLEPRVTFEGDLVVVRIHVFSGFSGLLQKTLSISREFPHTIVDESTEMLLEYFCGVVP